ncbi:MAG TPA: response regulator [Candidatus Polarisedimenticolaceae bacterium]|nr:response regulator [Candidatus Polarisedimenticolaceae bacterium]
MSPPEPLVLVVDDEPQLRRFLRASLPAQGYRLIEAATGEEALREAAARAPDLVLLDLGLPDLDGVEVTRRLREWSAAPILVLSARDQERDKIRALDAGADDYLTKPFGTGELLARMRVALRHATRGEAADEPVVATGDMRVDLAGRRVTVGGREVRLTRTEYRLLALLARHAGKVLTHRQLLKEVWGPGAVDQTHYLRVYMGQLRHKIEADPAQPRYLLTETGVGYRLAAE